MYELDKKVDAYIDKAAPFARPVLNHLRKVVHKACPEVQETIKWSFPHFEYHGILCSMAAFKQHCAFTFWNASLMSDAHKIFSQVKEEAMGQLGKLKAVTDIPSDELLMQYISEAMKLNAEGRKRPARVTKGVKKELKIPGYFSQALKRNKQAIKTFDDFNYSNKKEYIEWISEARTAETRNKRITLAVTWLSEGKVRNWKYLQK